MLSSVVLLSFFSFHRLHFSVAARLLSTKLVAREGQHLVSAEAAQETLWATSTACLKAAGFVFPIQLTPWMKSMDEIHRKSWFHDLKRLETSGKTTGTGTVQRSLTWSDLIHQTEWPHLMSSLATTSYRSEHDMYWTHLNPGLICWQRSQSAQPCHCTRSRTHLVRRCLAPWSRRCCHPPLPAQTQTPLWWISKWQQAVHTSLCCITLHLCSFLSYLQESSHKTGRYDR